MNRHFDGSAFTRSTSRKRVYRIRVKGKIEPGWLEWFEGLNISEDEEGNSLLMGLVEDEAALLGVLYRLQSFGLPLLSVIPI